MQHPRTVHWCKETQIEVSRRKRRQYKCSSYFSCVLLLLTGYIKVHFLHFGLFPCAGNHRWAHWRACVPEDFVCNTKFWSWSNEAILPLQFDFSIAIGDAYWAHILFYFSTYLLNVQSMAPYEHLGILKLSKEGIVIKRNGKTHKKSRYLIHISWTVCKQPGISHPLIEL